MIASSPSVRVEHAERAVLVGEPVDGRDLLTVAGGTSTTGGSPATLAVDAITSSVAHHLGDRVVVPAAR